MTKTLATLARSLLAPACILALAAPIFADHPGPITLKQNAGWNWFSDNRALLDGDKLLIGSVAGTTDASAHAGDVQLTTFYLKTRAAITCTLDPAATTDAKVATPAAPSDDHLVPVLLKRPDGRYLAVWQRHDADPLMRWRISINPNDPTSWQPVQTTSANTVDKNGICFSNVYRLSSENGRIYNLVRSVGYDPNYLISDDDGNTFRYGGHLMMWDNPEGKGLGRPYIRYASNNTDTIFFATTEDHPKDFNTGILAGYLRNKTLYQSNGTPVGPLSTSTDTTIKPTDFTRVFQGAADAVAYINDIQLIPPGRPGAGNPHLVFSVRKDPQGNDIRYFYARFNPQDKTWHTHEFAFAGSTIYTEESSYAGLASLDPDDENTLYLSANSNPKTGQPLISSADKKRHYELYKATTKNNGQSWSFTPITQSSLQDNLRPLIPPSATPHHPHILLWLQGTMTTYKNYDLNVAAIISQNE